MTQQIKDPPSGLHYHHDMSRIYMGIDRTLPENVAAQLALLDNMLTKLFKETRDGREITIKFRNIRSAVNEYEDIISVFIDVPWLRQYEEPKQP